MNKNAIKKFAIEARRKLIDSVTDKAGMLGITAESCSEPIAKGADFEIYQTTAGIEVTLNRSQRDQRRKLVSQINSRGFEAVVEEVAYTWFNRICAIRFMEVNDYLPNRVRVLSSEKEGKMEPDLVTQAPDVDLDLTAQEKEEIINWKMSGTSEDTDKLYCKLFLKQCHQLHDILPGLFEADSDYMELLFGISYTNKDDVIYMLVNPETGIPEADFNVSTLDEEGNPTGQVEIIGWLYQYYNTELKDDTFAKLKKNVKITKERIPAATQLFTPDWIVRYMVENSVGRIWIEHLRAVDPSTDEKVTAERFGWKYYLPEAEQEEAVNVKLAEIRTTYKDLKPTDITCIDPCMGNLDFIANALGNKGDTSREVIRNYFLKDFYADHLKIYQKRPIYWLFDSGKQNGFKALIYMHRYDADTVGRVRTDYLHRAQKYVETAMQSAQYTIDNATSASEKSKATKAVTKYTKQLAEMKIYDEAIAHIANKRIEIDLDDGVKVNYAKFQGVEVTQEGKKALKVDLLAKIK